MKKRLKLVFEDVLIILAAFVIIILVFFGVNLGLSKIISITGNAVAGESNSPSQIQWIIVTIVSALAVVGLLELAVKKRLFKIKWNVDS